MTDKIYDYYAATVAGLEDLVVADLRKQLKQIDGVRVERGQRHGRVRFHYERSPRKLLDLRSVENLFACVGEVRGLTVGPQSLDRIASGLADLPWQSALALHDLLHGPPERPAFAVIPHLDRGGRRFTSGDVSRVAQAALAAALGFPADPARLVYNFHLHFAKDRALVGLQLFRGRAWKRPYRRAPRPGSLEGTVAYLIGQFTDPQGRDRILDPVCGAGTTLIERGLTAPAGLLAGGDIDRPALLAARESAEAAGVRIRLTCWDATCLPLRDAGFDRLTANLPYGKKQIVRLRGPDPDALRPFLTEMARVLRPGGLAVVLTEDARGLEGIVDRKEVAFWIARTCRAAIRGVAPTIFVLKRT